MKRWLTALWRWVTFATARERRREADELFRQCNVVFDLGMAAWRRGDVAEGRRLHAQHREIARQWRRLVYGPSERPH